MLRKKKLFARPKKAYELQRIREENSLLEKYGLKNKREVWKSIAKVGYFRDRAKALAKAPFEEQEVLFNKLRRIGLKADSIADVLALQVEDLLKRRLPTVVARKGISNTVKHARQLVVHKKITVDGKVINIPSYLVAVSEEGSIKIRGSPPKKKNLETEKVAPEGESA